LRENWPTLGRAIVVDLIFFRFYCYSTLERICSKRGAQGGDKPLVQIKPQALAEQGNAEAQNGMGALYYHGYGVAQDFRRARSVV
jgi:hypothetical protein